MEDAPLPSMAETVCSLWPSLDADACEAVLMSSGYRLTDHVWASLGDLAGCGPHADVQSLLMNVGGLQGLRRTGAHQLPTTELAVGHSLALLCPDGSPGTWFMHGVWVNDVNALVTVPLQPVMHDVVRGLCYGHLTIHRSAPDAHPDTAPTPVLCIEVMSPPAAVAAAFDHVWDTLYWTWPGQWTDGLEAALLELLVCCDESLESALSGVAQMMRAMGSLASAGVSAAAFERMGKQVREDVSAVVADHDRGALGRLHQMLFPLLQVGTMMGLPGTLTSALQAVERAKMASGQGPGVRAAVERLNGALFTYARFLAVRGLATLQDPLVSFLGNAKMTCDRMLAQPAHMWGGGVDPAQLRSLHTSMQMSLAGSLVNALSQLGAGGAAPSFEALPGRVCMYPSINIPSQLLGPMTPENPWPADPIITHLTQHLVEGVVMFQPSPITLEGAAQRAQLVDAVLHLGLGYAGSDAGIAALHQSKRAALLLDTDGVAHHHRLFSRVRDCARLLRKGTREGLGSLFLRFNTDMDTALARLQAHHPQSWADDDVVAMWSLQRDQGTFVVVELWHVVGEGDTLTETLIAADFGHAIPGGVFYVATRFYDRAYRNWNPGFMLAAASARALYEHLGVRLWDLGPTDSNPAMAYKADIAHTMHRLDHLHTFRGIRAQQHQREAVADVPLTERVKALAHLSIGPLTSDNLITVKRK